MLLMPRSYGFGFTRMTQILSPKLLTLWLQKYNKLTPPSLINRKLILQQAQSARNDCITVRWWVSYTPLTGYFSPFPQCTNPLSVISKYLAFRGGPRKFKEDFTCPPILRMKVLSYWLNIWLSQTMADPARFSRQLAEKVQNKTKILQHSQLWVSTSFLSLAATTKIALAFCSTEYWDVSLFRVRPRSNMVYRKHGIWIKFPH